jgi:hypothetical protein
MFYNIGSRILSVVTVTSTGRTATGPSTATSGVRTLPMLGLQPRLATQPVPQPLVAHTLPGKCDENLRLTLGTPTWANQ